jgi:vancomycin resistance protein YoaR
VADEVQEAPQNDPEIDSENDEPEVTPVPESDPERDSEPQDDHDSEAEPPTEVAEGQSGDSGDASVPDAVSPLPAEAEQRSDGERPDEADQESVGESPAEVAEDQPGDSGDSSVPDAVSPLPAEAEQPSAEQRPHEADQESVGEPPVEAAEDQTEDPADTAVPGPVAPAPADLGMAETERLERDALYREAFLAPLDLLAERALMSSLDPAFTPPPQSPVHDHADPAPSAGEDPDLTPYQDEDAEMTTPSSAADPMDEAEPAPGEPDFDEPASLPGAAGETGELEPVVPERPPAQGLAAGSSDEGAAEPDEAAGSLSAIGDTREQEPVEPESPQIPQTPTSSPPRRISVLASASDTAAQPELEADTGELPVVAAAGAGTHNDTMPLPVGRSGKPLKSGKIQGRRKRRARWVIPLVIVVLAAAGYVGASYYFANRVPKGASVVGVDIGGLTDVAAVDRLRAELDAKAKEAVAVVVGEEEAAFDPVIAGVGFSPEDTVAQVTGLTFNPVRLWDHIGGIEAVKPSLTVNREAMESHVAALAAQTRVEPVDGTLAVATGEIVTTEPSAGLSLDTAAAIKQIQADYLAKAGPWQLPVSELAPKIGREQLDEAIETLAKPILSGPVSLVVADATVELPTAEIAAAALIGPDPDGSERLSLDWDKELLEASVSKRLPAGLETQAEDARFVFVDGQPVIEEGRKGSKLNPDRLVEAISSAALASGGARLAAVELAEADPAAGRAELEQMGIKEIVGRFETQATNSVDRTKNLRKAAEIVTGMLVRPGETFSLDQALGHRSLETGWFNAGVVVSGVSQDGIGGGLSQFSTTLYNAAHLAGMVDVEHQPHANYFSRYPTGREATLWEGQIDNKFKNDTPYGVVLRAGVTDSLKVWVELWSTKYWTVEAGIDQPYAYVAPRTIESTKADCEPQSMGSSGFQVDYWRIRTDPDGNAQAKETWHWRYDPMNAIVCKKPGATQN